MEQKSERDGFAQRFYLFGGSYGLIGAGMVLMIMGAVPKVFHVTMEDKSFSPEYLFFIGMFIFGIGAIVYALWLILDQVTEINKKIKL